MAVKEKNCSFCEKMLSKDEIALNKKILENLAKKNIYRCLDCLADYLECDKDELLDKIEEFKAEGCKLFN